MISTTLKPICCSVLAAAVSGFYAPAPVLAQAPEVAAAALPAPGGSTTSVPASGGSPVSAAKAEASESEEGGDAGGTEELESAEILAEHFSAKEQAIAERAEARWQALANGDFATAYGFTLPSYRQTHTADQYRSSFGSAVKWHMAKVLGIRYDSSTTAQVRLALEVEFVPTSGGHAERLVTRLDETWLERDGSWFISVTR